MYLYTDFGYARSSKQMRLLKTFLNAHVIFSHEQKVKIMFLAESRTPYVFTLIYKVTFGAFMK